VKTERDFERGPYKYSRSPTHNGLTLMTLGLSLVINSFFTFLFMIAAALITRMIFLKEEEALLEKKYGEAYCEYKKKVHTWI
jgi:protein-S-isoprenylcysteine O-methyltransferase Ste14